MAENNVIYIKGETYPHYKRLSSIAEFDSALKVWVAAISKKKEVEALCSQLNLSHQSDFDDGFVEPRNENERELRKIKSSIKLKTVKIFELESKIEDIQNCGNLESRKAEIEAIETTINELRETIGSLEEKQNRLKEEARRGRTERVIVRSLRERANSGTDWLKTNPPRMKMILNRRDGVPFFPKSIVGLLVGAGGAGKTRTAMQLAYCVATGIPFFDLFDVADESRAGKVFFGLGEEPEENIWRRLKAVHDHYNPLLEDFINGKPSREINLDNLQDRLILHSFQGQNVRFTDEKGSLTAVYSELLNELKRQEGESGFDLIILDPIARFQGAQSEIDNNAATDFVSALERLSRELKGNPTILICHHMVKNGEFTNQNASRGSSGLTDGVRWQMNVATPKTEKSGTPAKGLFALELVKHNDVRPLLHPILMKFSEDGVLVPATSSDCAEKNVNTETFFPEFQRSNATSPPKNSVYASTNLA